MLGKLASIAMAMLMVGLMVTAGMTQEPPVKTKTESKQTGKVEGWVKINGGPTVFLRPNIDAYEHDTGLVRDMRTGQKSRPITPQSVAPQTYFLTPATPVQPYLLSPAPVYEVPRSPYPSPYAVNPYQNPYAYQQPWYDVGPGNVYATPNGQRNHGAKIGSPGTINQRWQHTRLPK